MSHATWGTWVAVALVPFFFWVAFSRKPWPSLVIVSWMVVQIAMNLLNKMAAVYFKSTFLCVAIQMAIATIMLVTIEFRSFAGRRQDALKWSAVVVFFSGILSSSLWSFKKVSLSTVLILKNMLPIFEFGIEKFIVPAHINKGVVFTCPVFASLLVAVVGIALYGVFNVSTSNYDTQLIGYLLITVNCIFTIMDRTTERFLLKSDDFKMTKPTCLAMNNGVGTIIMVSVSLGTQEPWMETFVETTPLTWFWVLMSSVCGCCFGYLGIRTYQLVPATTSLVLQNFCKMLTVIISVFVFADDFNPIMALGCVLAFTGMISYGTLQLNAHAMQEKVSTDYLKISDENQKSNEAV